MDTPTEPIRRLHPLGGFRLDEMVVFSSTTKKQTPVFNFTTPISPADTAIANHLLGWLSAASPLTLTRIKPKKEASWKAQTKSPLANLKTAQAVALQRKNAQSK